MRLGHVGGAGHVGHHSPGSRGVERGDEQLALEAAEAGEIFRGAPPSGLGATAQRAEPGARGVDHDAVELARLFGADLPTIAGAHLDRPLGQRRDRAADQPGPVRGHLVGEKVGAALVGDARRAGPPCRPGRHRGRARTRRPGRRRGPGPRSSGHRSGRRSRRRRHRDGRPPAVPGASPGARPPGPARRAATPRPERRRRRAARRAGRRVPATRGRARGRPAPGTRRGAGLSLRLATSSSTVTRPGRATSVTCGAVLSAASRSTELVGRAAVCEQGLAQRPGDPRRVRLGDGQPRDSVRAAWGRRRRRSPSSHSSQGPAGDGAQDGVDEPGRSRTRRPHARA